MLPIGARCIYISLHYTENKFKSKANNLLRLTYSWGHCLKIVLYLAEMEIYLKIKTTAKLNSKQTSIAVVRDIYRMYATFLTPLSSHYRLPLKRNCYFIIQRRFMFS